MDKAEFDRRLDKLTRDIAKSHNYRVGDYKYFVYPYKGLLPLNSEQVENTVLLMSEIIPSNATMLFTVMTDGIILGLPLAMHL
ncbi:MAG: hypothetical protein U9N47_06990, partial [Thermodesulfobacteriota bacterium]|nr:hypothetical protein [Thermodesulfobacteriota bacterium]